jgi:hypothetical protein
MVKGVDRIVVSVPELDSAAADYSLLLGCAPSPPLPGSDAASSCCFDLNNTRIELTTRGEPWGIRGLVLASGEAAAATETVENSRGLDIGLCGAAAPGVTACGGAPSALRVDHLVLRTGDAEGCIELFSRRLGIRLALDQTVPEWGGRMLFFRTGKLTLEVIEPGSDAPARDSFWGIAYQCADIELTGAQLAQRGVALSSVRAGRKPGTLVMTVKSHCLGIPTLLIQPGVT